MYQLCSLLIGACTLAAASRINSMGKPYYPLEEAEIHFEAFIEKYNRSYSSEDEKNMRFQIFKQNLEMINNYNLDPLKSLHGITKFTDLTKEEFLRWSTGLDTSLRVPGIMVNISGPVTIDLPDTFSWVDQGVVTPVKNQGTCGGCWAFAAIGTLESSYARNHGGSLLQLSEQQLIDCDTTSHGCVNGVASNGLRYIQSAGGVEGEDDYPYKDQKGSCQFDSSKVKATVSQVIPYNLQSEEALRQSLYTDGPIAIAVNAATFDSYHGGIFKVYDCPAAPPSHAVLLVGYGTENGQPFWTIKNSWGVQFGESGYIRISRNENTCGLLNNFAVSAVAG